MSKVVRPKGRKKFPQGVAVAYCSLCEQGAVTFGQQYLGGIRYCWECFHHTLAWVQLSDEDKARLKALMDECARKDAEWLEVAKAIPQEQRKAHAIGESRRRLMDADMKDHGGKGFLP